MTKKNEIEDIPPSKVLYKHYWYVARPIISIVLGEPGKVLITYDDTKEKRFTNHATCCPDIIITGNAKSKIIRAEGQLLYDQGVAMTRSREDFNTLQGLEIAGLYLDMANRGDILAREFSSLYKSPEHKQLALDFIYNRYVIMYCGIALNTLEMLLKDSRCDEKEKVGKWIIYTHGRLLAYVILTKHEKSIERLKKEGGEIDELLIRSGLEHLVPAKIRHDAEPVKQVPYLPYFSAPLDALKSFFVLKNEGAKSPPSPKADVDKDRPHVD